MKIQIEYDKDTANRLLNEALDIISEIKDILANEDMYDEEALEEIADLLKGK
jgi:hypothetical protein